MTLIWAQDKNNGIGFQNKLPWHIPKEIDHFKKTTINKTVVMGRKTFESIGKPLPNRKNIVLTNDKNFFYPNIIIINNYLEILKKYNADDVFIIGGKSIYELFFPFANKLIISKIKNEFLCDTFINLDIHKFKLEKKIPYKDFDVEYYAI